jgi:hypothetical protein
MDLYGIHLFESDDPQDNRDDGTDPWSRPVWFLLFIIFTSIAVLFSVRIYRAFTSKNWPVTNGGGVAFYETPQYRYSVGGRTYSNDVASCNEFLLRGHAQFVRIRGQVSFKRNGHGPLSSDEA